MSDKPVIHGWDHRAGGLDPILPGNWIEVTNSPAPNWDPTTHYNRGDIVGDGVYNYLCVKTDTAGKYAPGFTPGWTIDWAIYQPIFQNGWDNQGGSLMPMRFRVSVGHYNFLDLNGDVTTISDHQVEIQGSVAGGNNFTIVFWLPPSYVHENNLRLPISDDLGGTTVMTVKSDGSVWKGLVP